MSTSARELQKYLIEALEAAHDDIVPELRSYIGGDSREAIDASIELAKAKTNQILQGIRQAQAADFTDGVRTGVGDQVPDVRGMSWSEYASARGQLGVTGRAEHGIFG